MSELWDEKLQLPSFMAETKNRIARSHNAYFPHNFRQNSEKNVKFVTLETQNYDWL